MQTHTHPHLASFLVFSPVLFTISILSSYQACLHQGLCNYHSFSWISLLPENHETGSLISKPLYKCHLFIEVFQTILFTSQHSISPHDSALFYFSPQHFSPVWHSIYSFIFFIVNEGKDFFFKDLLIDWLIAMLGLRFCARAFSSCGKRGPLLIALRGPLTVAASPVAEHRLQVHRLSSCGARA